MNSQKVSMLNDTLISRNFLLSAFPSRNNVEKENKIKLENKEKEKRRIKLNCLFSMNSQKVSMLNDTLISRNFLLSAFPSRNNVEKENIDTKKNLKVLFTCSRENSRHFAASPPVTPRNDVWETSVEIRYWWRVTIQDLGSASDWLKICFIW